ncbi:hypothetical protein COV05_02280 [Candidatus Uhrbacteria bacterium CG10_big_fil_rev_8_21_14_0_10_48_16]|uniref:Sporulation stage II protein D amidase enhancer LytB N-terminal domain-containing protein n=1 Tax=Candidatus Uhrbacteria bacterium CG10_big_fil_rev_8_21_14_0_10_48_16 TaxID=1975038 RepID=A0A2M8LHS7_9BACT|nr:MAG: hypothetical protein COV05_02280 [Candidatus Uhrbacteria bacterium CG10_big_fil_rev_8_21_14_0_10_48_16]
MYTLLLSESHAYPSRATKFSLVLVSIFLFFSGIFLLPASTEAASLKGFEALQVSAPKQGFTMEPGSTQEVLLTFKNIGEKTWVNSGSSYISVYTYDPKYRVSDFKADNWIDYTQASIMKESSVPVGGVGSIYLTLHAPNTEGMYKETFQLAAEDTAWVPGGLFTLSIVVKDSDTQESSVEGSLGDGEASPESDGLSAMILLRSQKVVTAKAGEVISYKVGIKNTGTVTWSSREVVTTNYAIASVDTEHSSWVSSTELVSNTTGTVKPGGLDFLTFSFKAPTSKGTHTVRYQMAVNDTVVPDFYIDIPVEVTSGSPEIIDEEVTVEESQIESDRVIDEPILRIGLLTIDEETDWVTEISCDTTWKLMDSEDGLLGVMEKDEVVRAFYKNQRYYFNRGRGIEETYKFLRFVPDEEDAICTIENFDRRETRGAAYAFNQFRDTLELQYIPYKDEVWVINELPIEEYLYGLGETSNYSHSEFKKTLLTIARTYGLYHWERNSKHKGYFHMNAYADDQVYFGYGYEVVHPLIKEAVEQTRGVTVSYEGRTAITPYFSRSDGRTRSWSEVWGGTVAWLIGKPAPCDAERGYSLWGHGVGLGATEALCMANNGSDWEEILHYFYTDVDLTKRWE